MLAENSHLIEKSAVVAYKIIMKINSLKVAGLYSFGPEQELNDFKTFNLFIGVNASGKTNVFKLLEGVELDYDIVKDTIGNPVFTSFEFFSGALSTSTHINTFTPTISSEQFNLVNNRFLHNANIKKSLEISYLDYNGSNALIKLEDCNGGHLRYIQGDIGLQKRCVKKLKKPQSEFEFYKDLVKFYDGSWLPLFNFALFYIFGLKIRFLNNGGFVQNSNYGGGSVRENTTELSSGMLHCAQLLTRYLKSDGTVILIDEPELYFEPRALRRFFEFLVWLSFTDSTGSVYISEISEKIQSLLDSNKSESGVSIFAEFAGNNEDGSPKYFEVNKFNTPGKQIFIASHSSVLINEFVKLQECGSIYRFKLEKKEYLGDNGEKFPGKNFVTKYYESFSTVSKINNETHGLLDDLGCKGSDLLQANGIIWVEGPSDVIYIRKWLEMYAVENSKKVFKQGIDYEFQMFGGTLLDSLCLIKDDNSTEEELKKLVSMFSFSRNAFIVTDSDAVKKAGKIIDNSKFQNAKQYIKKQFEEMKNPNLGLWYKEGQTIIRTIEDYIPKKCKPSRAGTKKLKAQDNIKVWDDKVKLSNFNHKLKNEIKMLYELIEKWAQ